MKTTGRRGQARNRAGSLKSPRRVRLASPLRSCENSPRIRRDRRVGLNTLAIEVSQPLCNFIFASRANIFFDSPRIKLTAGNAKFGGKRFCILEKVVWKRHGGLQGLVRMRGRFVGSIRSAGISRSGSRSAAAAAKKSNVHRSPSIRVSAKTIGTIR